MNEVLVGFLRYFVADGLEELAELVVLVFGEYIVLHKCVEEFEEIFGQIAGKVHPAHFVVYKSNKV